MLPGVQVSAGSVIRGVRPLLLPASYTPMPTAALGLQPDVPRDPAPVKERGGERVLRRAAVRSAYPSGEVVRLLSEPGRALIAFPGGVTLFVGLAHFQARSIGEALSAAADAGMVPSPIGVTPATRGARRGTSKARVYRPKPCEKPICGKLFTPSGPRSRFCVECS